MCEPAPIDDATICKLRATGDASQDEVFGLIRAIDEARQYREETLFTGSQLVSLLRVEATKTEQPVQTLARLLLELRQLRALNARRDVLDTRLEHASGVPPKQGSIDLRQFPRRS